MGGQTSLNTGSNSAGSASGITPPPSYANSSLFPTNPTTQAPVPTGTPQTPAPAAPSSGSYQLPAPPTPPEGGYTNSADANAAMKAYMDSIRNSGYQPVPMTDPNYNGIANALTANPFTNAMGMAPIDLDAIIAAGRERAATFNQRHPRANMVSPPGMGGDARVAAGGQPYNPMAIPVQSGKPPLPTPYAPPAPATPAPGPTAMQPVRSHAYNPFPDQVKDIQAGIPAFRRPGYVRR